MESNNFKAIASNKFKQFKQWFSKKENIIPLLFFIIPVITIVLKGAALQGFIQNSNAYSFNISEAFWESKEYISYYLGFTLVFLSFGYIFKGTGRIFYMLIINILITILIITDLAYFRGFSSVPSILIVTQTANLDNLGGSILSMFSPWDIIFVIDIIALIIYAIIYRGILKNSKRNLKAFIPVFLIPFLYVAWIPFNVFVMGNKEVSKGWMYENYDPTDTVKYLSPIGYHLFDIYNVYKDSKPYEYTEEDLENINNYMQLKNENLPDNEYFGKFKGKNLLIIQVESLESFVIGQSINGKEITPNLNKYIQNGIYFPNINEQVNHGTSSDSDLMVNTSVLPLRTGSTFFRYPGNTYNSLPKILARNGYDPISIHSDKPSFWNYAQGLRGIGYEKFVDQNSFEMDEIINMGLTDESYFKQVIPMIKELKQPFSAYTITLTNHGPFTFPDEKKQLGIEGELSKNLMGNFLETVHYTDTEIGKFLDELDKEGLLDNTVVAIFGDHNGVHKYYNADIEALSNPEPWFFTEGAATIPLILYDKTQTIGKTFDTIGGQIDIMPTLLYALGIDKNEYEGTALGRNLLNTNRSYAILTNGEFVGTVTEEEKQIFSKILDLSDKMIRGDYFKDKIPNK